jgi:hypothetical protein
LDSYSTSCLEACSWRAWFNRHKAFQCNVTFACTPVSKHKSRPARPHIATTASLDCRKCEICYISQFDRPARPSRPFSSHCQPTCAASSLLAEVLEHDLSSLSLLVALVWHHGICSICRRALMLWSIGIIEEIASTMWTSFQ